MAPFATALDEMLHAWNQIRQLDTIREYYFPANNPEERDDDPSHFEALTTTRGAAINRFWSLARDLEAEVERVGMHKIHWQGDK